MQTIEHKRSRTFRVAATYLDGDGALVDLTDVTIRATVRDRKRNVVAELTVTKDADQAGAGMGKFALSADSSAWPIVVADCDIAYAFADASKDASETFVINIEAGITE